MVQHLVEFALEGSDFIGGEVQIPFPEVAAHLLGNFADFLFEGLALLGQAGLDDALVDGAAVTLDVAEAFDKSVKLLLALSNLFS